jgi:hypothetical protein
MLPGRLAKVLTVVLVPDSSGVRTGLWRRSRLRAKRCSVGGVEGRVIRRRRRRRRRRRKRKTGDGKLRMWKSKQTSCSGA